MIKNRLLIKINKNQLEPKMENYKKIKINK